MKIRISLTSGTYRIIIFLVYIGTIVLAILGFLSLFGKLNVYFNPSYSNTCWGELTAYAEEFINNMYHPVRKLAFDNITLLSVIFLTGLIWTPVAIMVWKALEKKILE